eukprot:TRINITY_DN31523_c0_g1_i1.p1 TRINITY_DN31523_c0_g1~~TRINITY_DN31523_c0_g1_i1.p1  ORF type:complete len:211 (-),score=9.77 TRINITY_DN31523_c0_g1_i1:96-662(-)
MVFGSRRSQIVVVALIVTLLTSDAYRLKHNKTSKDQRAASYPAQPSGCTASAAPPDCTPQETCKCGCKCDSWVGIPGACENMDEATENDDKKICCWRACCGKAGTRQCFSVDAAPEKAPPNDVKCKVYRDTSKNTLYCSGDYGKVFPDQYSACCCPRMPGGTAVHPVALPEHCKYDSHFALATDAVNA